MKISKTKTHVKFILIVTILIILAGGGVFAYFHFRDRDQSDQASSTPTKQLNKSSSSTPAAASNSSSSSSSTPSSSTKDVTQYSDSSGNSSTNDNNSGKVSITATQNGATVRISTNISNIWNSGVCSATISNGTTSTTKTAGIQAMPSYSTCQGFSIPTSELGAGTWKIALTVTHESQTITGNTEVVVK